MPLGFGKKKKVDNSDSVDAEPSVFFGGIEIGKILRVKGKEIQGQEHVEFLIRLNVGAGIDRQLREVLTTQGLYIGKPF